ncbi:MAG: 4'-phosphopantetheinyl transferase superfamily protein [Planctomycetes bacterium]|nr:4'-phosphopantetheinyl transferase superfamily protein [Planctomycetota bacterium]
MPVTRACFTAGTLMEFADLFPPECAFRVLDLPSAVVLTGRECELAAAMAEGPRLLFTLSRGAAHECLRALGARELEIGRGRDRQPLWPEAFVVSITHTTGLAAAVVGRAGEFRSLGVDVEACDREINPAIRTRICSPEELEIFDDCPRTLLSVLGAKESIYKACYPLGGVRLFFGDVVLEAVSGGFNCHLKRQVAPELEVGSLIEVRQRIRDGMLYSAVHLPVSARLDYASAD